MKKILQIENLKTYFRTPDGIVKAVDGISFHLNEAEVLALVGESGCGKSVTVMTILGLIKCPPAIVQGSIRYGEIDLLKLSNEEYRKIRGKKISMIFQEPMSSFDPLYTVGKQMMEVAMAHLNCNPDQARQLCIDMLKKVQIPLAEKRFDEYPHEMSGGMLQRIMIAMALLTNPDVLIADEPTTALDVTIQAQVLNLFRDLQSTYRTSVIFITHDLGVVAELANRVHVMYAGKIVERATVEQIFKSPKHPYTKGLLRSRVRREYKGKLLPYVPGYVPSATNFPKGCRFHPRCEYAKNVCIEQEPPEFFIDGTGVSCWLYARSDEK
ncbi:MULTISPECIES: ABC transporter ATP-binding protein [Pseudothermotoga]|jgi:peptide/nickel transport system ATP-binding protein|uniref:Oligopeptide/dipeptide ABC transporter, ATPase subunit n=1 Tax=Pseudothermotoga lettingae (strain ATCC BAA-301 / DSM 14385 / NBRC 107922 / TMO) TaxID=416591 RepID=A8F7F0_PSELT|nr:MULTISPECIES: ABC transporter ATP-binding protein [Pseudothermotoga]ABV34084.1 oligopeptide/dipeptide ABC transporter, ATPase subunit [Pseudothermotoga lettingae TMO]MDI3494671.1 peptide/nickel transport system ATP-binding protein [Pseudothermotoga sp.]MDK2884709.1 peptide/nickel transport system ATP-binding protein [Pseudothermotoga sp.]GLI48977.1 ABC transporter ATP-binding protein [Pseudothermotoga lettingae TMO]HBJ81825.1 ABC transporter ATP-binding protein [Pseudothermotoga sp.]